MFDTEAYFSQLNDASGASLLPPSPPVLHSQTFVSLLLHRFPRVCV